MPKRRSNVMSRVESILNDSKEGRHLFFYASLAFLTAVVSQRLHYIILKRSTFHDNLNFENTSTLDQFSDSFYFILFLLCLSFCISSTTLDRAQLPD